MTFVRFLHSILLIYSTQVSDSENKDSVDKATLESIPNEIHIPVAQMLRSEIVTARIEIY